MGMIRSAVDKTSSMKDVAARGLPRDPEAARDRALAETGYECRESEIDTIVEFDQALDSSRSHGYGRYEI